MLSIYNSTHSSFPVLTFDENKNGEKDRAFIIFKGNLFNLINYHTTNFFLIKKSEFFNSIRGFSFYKYKIPFRMSVHSILYILFTFITSHKPPNKKVDTPLVYIFFQINNTSNLVVIHNCVIYPSIYTNGCLDVLFNSYCKSLDLLWYFFHIYTFVCLYLYLFFVIYVIFSIYSSVE